MNDLKFAFRQLLKNPGFTAVSVLTLALGIGACTAIFSVVNCVLLRPLAYPQSDRLVVIQETKLPRFPEFAVAPANYLDWRAQASSFDQLAALSDTYFNLTGIDEPVRVHARRVTPNYLTTLRARPMLGRDFSEAEVAARANVALLTHGFWVRRFGGRPDVVGETIPLDGQRFTIIGVLARNFQPGDHAEMYTPLPYDEDRQNRGGKNLSVIGRLKPGVPLEQALTELTLVAARLAKQYPDPVCPRPSVPAFMPWTKTNPSRAFGPLPICWPRRWRASDSRCFCSPFFPSLLCCWRRLASTA
jgi:putative ABC transport system permease protein